MGTKRSPILGYNHNFRFRGVVFHVQTEDSGVDNPHVFTHLFHGGVILSSRKLNYDSEAAEDVVKSLMQAQHKSMLRDLRRGQFDVKIDERLGHLPGLEPASRPAAGEEILKQIPSVPGGARADSDVSAAFDAIRAETEPPEADARQLLDDERFSPPPVPFTAEDLLSHEFEEAAPDSIPVQDTIKNDHPDGSYSQHRRARLVRPEEVHEVPTAPITWRDTEPTLEPTPAPPKTASGSRPVGKRARSESQPIAAQVVNEERPRAQSRSPRQTRPGVVVSRPAVIIGAPPKVVGGAQEKRAPRPGRRAREEQKRNRAGGLFGKDLISERSLDEVILAYLSEDGEES